MEELVSDVDRVYHMASAVGVRLIMEQPVRTIETIFRGTDIVLAHCAKYRKRVLIPSTSEVYGKGISVPFKEEDDLLTRIPNPPDPTAPDGFTEEDAVEVRRSGDPPSLGFEPRDHLELGEIDMERGAKVSGSRFAYRLGDMALAELALYRFALDRLAKKGFTPVLPPVLVREAAMYGTGFLPTEEVNIYRIERDDLYLTGTSEVALHWKSNSAPLTRALAAFSVMYSGGDQRTACKFL